MPQLGLASLRRSERRLRVLLVEDDYELRRMVASVLRYDGHEVTELSNGQELVSYVLGLAPTAIGSGEPDVILTDVCLPQRSGLSALEQLRAARVTTPVVLMTAFPERCEPNRAEQLGAVTLLEKPFDLDDLRMIVLNMRGLRRSFGARN